MILNCKDPFNHSYTNLTVCVLPLLSSPLTVSVVVVACIKYSHRDRVSFSLSLRSRPYVGTSPDPSPWEWKCSRFAAQSPVWWQEQAAVWGAGSRLQPQFLPCSP